MPVAGGDLRQQRQDRVAEVAVPRDQLPRLAGDEPVRLRIVDLAAGNRAGDRLAARRDPSGCRRSSTPTTSISLRDGAPVTGHDGRADAALRSCTITAMRGSPAAASRARPCRSASPDASSTTKIRSTKLGIPASVSPISASSFNERARRRRSLFEIISRPGHGTAPDRPEAVARVIFFLFVKCGRNARRSNEARGGLLLADLPP